MTQSPIKPLMTETVEKNKEMLRKIKRDNFKKLRGKINLDIDLKKFRAQDMIRSSTEVYDR